MALKGPTKAELLADNAREIEFAKRSINIGDKVRSRSAPRGSIGYDDGIVVSVSIGGKKARVAWRRAKKTYEEWLEDLVLVAPIR